MVKQGEDGYTKFEDINRRLGDEEKADSASNEAPFYALSSSRRNWRLLFFPDIAPHKALT